MVVVVNVCSRLVAFVDVDTVNTAAVAVVDVFDVINVDDVCFLDHVSTIDLNACDCLLLLLAIVACSYCLFL